MTKREHHTPGEIRLRAIEPEDLPDLIKWRNNDKEFYREYRFINKPHQDAWYKRTIGDKDNMHYAIDVWGSPWMLIGSCNWSSIDWLNHHAELGIYIGDPEWRGKGIGLKTMIELHRIAFHELNMQTVRLEVFSFNPSVDLYAKFGYKPVGRWRKAQCYHGELEDSILMDMTKAEWKELWDERYSQG